jgi:hypothetical protein
MKSLARQALLWAAVVTTFLAIGCSHRVKPFSET